MRIAITGASGKTGYRISEEAVKKGYKVRQIIRKNSKVSEGLESLETIRVSLDNKKPIGNCILTCLTKKQALERINKGSEAAKAVTSILSK